MRILFAVFLSLIVSTSAIEAQESSWGSSPTSLPAASSFGIALSYGGFIGLEHLRVSGAGSGSGTLLGGEFNVEAAMPVSAVTVGAGIAMQFIREISDNVGEQELSGYGFVGWGNSRLTFGTTQTAWASLAYPIYYYGIIGLGFGSNNNIKSSAFSVLTDNTLRFSTQLGAASSSFAAAGLALSYTRFNQDNNAIQAALKFQLATLNFVTGFQRERSALGSDSSAFIQAQRDFGDLSAMAYMLRYFGNGTEVGLALRYAFATKVSTELLFATFSPDGGGSSQQLGNIAFIYAFNNFLSLRASATRTSGGGSTIASLGLKAEF